ncbi:MAG TPA: phosphate acetyltransferase [Polyangiaceae bacterium]|nr:phosphate acetyltransferase [Polyangiaceae bacterium]
MAEFLMLVPTAPHVGLTTISVGLVRAFEREGVRVGFVKPIEQPRSGRSGGSERSTNIVRAAAHLEPPVPLTWEQAERAVREGEEQRLMEDVIARVSAMREHADVVVVEGLVPTEDVPFATQLNASLRRTLDADLILVAAPVAGPDAFVEGVRLTASSYPRDRVAGVIVNKARDDVRQSATPASLKFPSRPPTTSDRLASPFTAKLADAGFVCIGSVPRRELLGAPRVRDLADALGARVIREGDLDRRVLTFRLAAMTVPHCLTGMNPGTLVVTPADRNDVIMATCLMVLRGIPIAGLWLACGLEPDPRVLDLCARAFELGLPALLVDDMTLEATSALLHLDNELPVNDPERVELTMNTVADCLDREWIRNNKWRRGHAPRLSPPAFRYKLIERAHAANRRIVLPEGTEPRTLRAATICHERGIARCVLLGSEAQIRRVAADQGLELPEDVEILDPESAIDRYVEPLLERRKHKGLSEHEARNQLHNEVMLGTVMLALGEVDGLVSGAIHTTADTVRPALQLVKTAPGVQLVSSVFFMCLPEQVLVYGDCAINTDPSAPELADIALQSAASAEAFGIEPRVALISYSTGTSGSGAEVTKVREATEIARTRRPDLPIDGPLQYDAAVMPEVARVKAPESPVAGRASVIVFPDLNTGNTTYKAVQRSAKVVSIGPMLQGLAKPVNDLSRGALVEDIVYTIALTAIQAATPSASPRLFTTESVDPHGLPGQGEGALLRSRPAFP